MTDRKPFGIITNIIASSSFSSSSSSSSNVNVSSSNPSPSSSSSPRKRVHHQILTKSSSSTSPRANNNNNKCLKLHDYDSVHAKENRSLSPLWKTIPECSKCHNVDQAFKQVKWQISSETNRLLLTKFYYTNLKKIDLGQITLEIVKEEKLQRFQGPMPRFGSELLPHITPNAFPKVTHLSLIGTDIQDTQLPRIPLVFPNLTFLSLGTTKSTNKIAQITGSALKYLLPLQKLTSLKLLSCQIRDPPHMHSFHTLLGLPLTSLAITGVTLTDLSCPLLAAFPKLKSLDLRGTSITISGLRSLICRREIKNSSCEQYGTVTTSFTQYSTLRKVLVPNTSMVGYLRGLTPISAGSGLIIDPEHITRLQIKALKVQLNLHQASVVGSHDMLQQRLLDILYRRQADQILSQLIPQSSS